MDLYSKRTAALEGQAKSYIYTLCEQFRNQVIFIWRDAIGYRDQPISSDLKDTLLPQRYNSINARYKKVNTILCEELGFDLDGIHPFIDWGSACTTLRSFFMRADTDHALDVIELMFAEIKLAQDDSYYMGTVQPPLRLADAAKKLNSRFLEHAIGFRLEQGRIIRIDSGFLHAEAVEPALQLMHAQGFEGGLGEFMLAQKYYRQGRDHYDDCLTNCGKALESALKTICDRRKWAYKAGDTASKLLELVFSKNLIPSYLQSHFSALRSTLECGVPTIRNREGGHGSGEKPNEVPEYLAAYQLHLTASAIVYLIRANHDYDKRKP